jgi:DNA-binding XRE family transcriptional regulator
MMTDKEIAREIERMIGRLKSMAGEEYGGQSELAREIGVPRQRLNDWLTGKRTPDLAAWLKIQAFLKKNRKKREQK